MKSKDHLHLAIWTKEETLWSSSLDLQTNLLSKASIWTMKVSQAWSKNSMMMVWAVISQGLWSQLKLQVNSTLDLQERKMPTASLRTSNQACLKTWEQKFNSITISTPSPSAKRASIHQSRGLLAKWTTVNTPCLICSPVTRSMSRSKTTQKILPKNIFTSWNWSHMSSLITSNKLNTVAIRTPSTTTKKIPRRAIWSVWP